MIKDAQWIRHKHIFSDDTYECSLCGYISEGPYSVCPGCGRQMHGSEYDPSWIDEIEEFEMMDD